MLEKILGYGEGLSIDHVSDEPQPLGSTLAFGTQKKLHKKFKRGIPSGPTKRTNFKKYAQQNGNQILFLMVRSTVRILNGGTKFLSLSQSCL